MGGMGLMTLALLPAQISTAKIPSRVRCVHVGVHVGLRKPCETCLSGSQGWWRNPHKYTRYAKAPQA